MTKRELVGSRIVSNETQYIRMLSIAKLSEEA